MLGECAAPPPLYVGFYSLTCPLAETIVNQVVTEAVTNDPSIAASLLRLMFHDCFVQGCDGSILLDREPFGRLVEKNAIPNQTVRGYEVIDSAKAALEVACPGTVSCSDIVALAARDAVALSGGPTWQVPTGRRDGNTSFALAAVFNVPPGILTTPVLTRLFASQGLSQDEMITLSGSHTIGRAHCVSFINRLARNDGTLDPAFAVGLRRSCPIGGDLRVMVPLDSTTPFVFDNKYFDNLAQHRGLLTSDQDLYTNSSTQPSSNLNLVNSNLWANKFALAMVHLSTLNVLTGTVGEIRRTCRAPN